MSFQPRLREGDFWGVMQLGGNSFAIRPEALDHGLLEVFLAPAGELLPLPYQGREFKILNITECIDALDHERTKWKEPVEFDEQELAEMSEFDRQAHEELPERKVVDEPVFRLDRLGWQLFKVPETAITSIYYWERSLDGEEEQFRRYCENEGLTGLVFTPIYTTESPW